MHPPELGTLSEMTDLNNISDEQIEQLARRKFHEKLVEHDKATKQKMIEAMRENNADPAYIYAFEKTGILVFQETMDALTEEQMEEWAQAYDEYSSET